MNSRSEGDIMGTTIQSGFEGAIMSNLSEQAVSSRPNSTTPKAKAKQSARDKALSAFPSSPEQKEGE